MQTVANSDNRESSKPQVSTLVADDDPNCLDLIERFLEHKGYYIKTASNGSEAWEILQSDEYQFDVVILDRLMPGLDGIQVLQKMKSQERLNNIPVIFQTGLIDIDDIELGMQKGAYYYLTKPYERVALISIVDAAIEETCRKKQLQNDVQLSTGDKITSSNGHIVIKSLKEINHVACALANLCPQPKQVVSGLSELLMNALEHGNLGIGYDEKAKLLMQNNLIDEINRRLTLPEHSNMQVNIFWEKSDLGIKFIIIDEGSGFIPDKYMKLDPNRATHPHGRGIAMAKMLSFSNIEYIGCGNRVEASITF